MTRASRGATSSARAKKLERRLGVAHRERGAAGADQRVEAARIVGEGGEVAAQLGAGAGVERLHDRARRQRAARPAAACATRRAAMMVPVASSNRPRRTPRIVDEVMPPLDSAATCTGNDRTRDAARRCGRR